MKWTRKRVLMRFKLSTEPRGLLWIVIKNKMSNQQELVLINHFQVMSSQDEIGHLLCSSENLLKLIR